MIKEARLYIVPTPIGNMEDMTLRGIRILKEADLILAEDTRHSAKLLKHYNIDKKTSSYHAHSEHEKTEKLVQFIKEKQQHACLVTDAGTPGISDPGYLLVKQAISESIAVECLPGATAMIPALILSGFANHTFIFWGFLPAKKGRKKALQQVAQESRTSIIYESPHRIQSLICDLQHYLAPDRMISVSKEITKIHEKTIRGTINAVARLIKNIPSKGEFTLVISQHN